MVAALVLILTLLAPSMAAAQLLTGALAGGGGGGVTSIIAGSGISVDQATGNVTVTNTGVGGAAFNALTTGTNTTATMTVGTGATLNRSGSGVIDASLLGGATFAAPGAIGGGTPGTAAFTTMTATSLNKVAVTAPTTSATLTIADGASLITSGAFAVTLTATGTTNATLPAGTKTLVATDVATLSSLTSIGTIGTGVWQGTAVGFGFGGTGLTSAADDTVMVSNGTAWQAKAVPDCTDTGGNHLNYTASTNAFSCGTGVGSAAFSSLTGGTNASAAMVVGTGASLTVSGSGTINATTLLGNTWASPGTIGGTTPGAATFTNVTVTGTLTTTGTPGAITVTNIAAPATPSAGLTNVYVDSTTKVGSFKDDAGNISVSVRPDAGASNNFLTGITTAGAITKAQPSAANLSNGVTGSGAVVLQTDAQLLGEVRAASMRFLQGGTITASAGQLALSQATTTIGVLAVYGPDTSNNGVIQFSSFRSNGTNQLNPLVLNADGSGTFLGAVKTQATSVIFQSAGVTGTLAWAPATSNKTITLPNGTTDFTATGGTSQVVKQVSAGAAFTVGQLAFSDLSGSATLAQLPAEDKKRGIVFEIGDPAGSTLTVASTTTSYVTVPFACTISAYNLAIDAGTITVKFWKVATGTAIPTSSNSINTSGVGISSGTAIHSTTVSDFTTTTVTANDILAMNVTAVATAKYVSGTLQCDL